MNIFSREKITFISAGTALVLVLFAGLFSLLKAKFIHAFPSSVIIGFNAAAIAFFLKVLHDIYVIIRIKNEMQENAEHLAEGTGRLLLVLNKLAEGDLSVRADETSKLPIINSIGRAVNRIITLEKEIVLAARQLAGGNLSVQYKPRSDKDELGQVFNDMIWSLKALITSVRETSESVGIASETLTFATDQTNKTMGQVTETIKQMSAASQQTAESTQKVAQLSNAALDGSISGGKSMEKLQEKMVSIKETVELNAKVMGELESKASQISDIVKAIQEIASQTNLLSLNATIEAARAGDAGRGFAVVAEEVGKLADDSARWAKQINVILKELKGSADKASKMSKISELEVRNGVELMTETSRQFHRISDSVKEVSEHIEQIAAVTEESAASSEETTASMEEQEAVVNEIDNSAKTLSQAVNKLNEQVSRFKVE